MKRIAILITCYNRVQTTLRCLDTLLTQGLPSDCLIETFLVDASSPDKTGEKVRVRYPQVHVIEGPDTLFWCSGMRVAWAAAEQYASFDAFLWVNDDAELNPDAIIGMVNDAEETQWRAIISGAFVNSDGTTSYGGQDSEGRLMSANGTLQKIHAGLNGNFLLVPRFVYEKIGGLNKNFVHGAGDYEYGWRAQRKGFSLYLSRNVVGVCNMNEGRSVKKLLEKSLLDRFRYAFAPCGLGLWDHFYYRMACNDKLRAYGSIVKWVLICLCPKLITTKY